MYGFSGYGTNAYASPRIEDTVIAPSISIGEFIIYAIYGRNRTLLDTERSLVVYDKGRSFTISAR